MAETSQRTEGFFALPPRRVVVVMIELHYIVPADLVSGQDPGDETDNMAVRDFLRHNQPDRVLASSDLILTRWSAQAHGR